jgi:mRNA interferase HicA
VNDREFVKRIRKIARTRGIEFRMDPKRGKGSHRTLYFGERKTTVKKGEIGPGLLSEMIRQLGLRSSDL